MKQILAGSSASPIKYVNMSTVNVSLLAGQHLAQTTAVPQYRAANMT